MKQIKLLLIIMFFANLSAESQIERLDSVTFNTYISKNKHDVYFSIMKRNNRSEIIKNYKAFLITSEKDTIKLFHDSIITVGINFSRRPSFPSSKLIVLYGENEYILPNIEKYLVGVASNIWFVINDTCVGNKYVLHVLHPVSILQEIELDKPDIYVRSLGTFQSSKQRERSNIYISDSTIIKINHKKNKYIIPNW